MTGKELYDETHGCWFWQDLLKDLQEFYEQAAITITEKYFADNWISVEDEMPQDKQMVSFQTNSNSTFTGYYDGKTGSFVRAGNSVCWTVNRVKLWQPKPKAREEK